MDLLQIDPALRDEAPLPGPPEELQTGDTGNWPRMLSLSEDVEDKLAQYLDHEIHQCWAERSMLVEDWKQWQKDYWAKPASKVKNFPFKRAANVVIPLTAISVEAIYSRMLNTLFSVEPFFSIRPRTPAWVDAAPYVEQWLQSEVEDANSLDMYGFAQDSLLELIKLGTGVAKSGYERIIKKVNEDTVDGGSVDRFVETKNGATLDYVPLANFLMRIKEKDPQTAAWVGEEHSFSWSQLKKMVLSGRMRKKAVEEIKVWWSDQRSSESIAHEYEEEREDLENVDPLWFHPFDVQEVWLGYDVDGDGVDEEIVVDFHRASRQILSVRYNWYSDLHRPYRIGTFIPVEGRWAGIGVGKQSEQFQALITTVHRQRLDAGTLANMGQIALKKTSGYGPGEPIFPGKIWFLDDVADIKEFQLSDTHHIAQLNNEETARQYHDKRVGVSELHLGIPQQGTPGTATSDLARLAEGNRKFDAALKNVRRWYSLLGQDIIANFQMFGNQDRHWLVQGRNGEWTEQFLSLPAESVRRGAAVDLTVTDSVTNKDVEQQKWQGLFAILNGHYDKVLERAIQVMQITGDPQLFLMFAQKALDASNEVTKRLLATHDEPDASPFLIQLDEALGDARPQPSGNGTPGASPEPSGTLGPERVLELAASIGGLGRLSP